MDQNLGENERAALYQEQRERTPTPLKNKHLRQFDQEFALLTQSNPAMRVLEIGCGTGLFLRYLEARGYRDNVGMDLDEGLRPHLSDLHQSKIFLGDIFKRLGSGLDGRQFDRVVMFDTAEHIRLDKLVSMLKRIRTLMNPDGRLLLRVPNGCTPWGMDMFYSTFDHVTLLTPRRMNELAILAGYSCIGIYPQQPTHWKKRLRLQLAKAILPRISPYNPDIWSVNMLAVFAPVQGEGDSEG